MDKQSIMAKRVQSKLAGMSPLIIMLIVFLIFGLLNALHGINFISPSNLSTILNQACFLIIVGIGQSLVILVGGINLSMGSVMAFTTVMWGEMLLKNSGINPWIPSLLIIGSAALIGLMSGLMITKLKITPYIATFAVMYAFRGLAWVYLRNRVIYNLDLGFRQIATGWLYKIGKFSITVPMVIALAALVLFYFFLRHTNLGRKWYFTGANPVAAKFSGINTDRIILLAYTISTALAGFAGLMYMARLNSTEPGMAGKSHFEAITVALIGGFSMAGGYGNIWGVAGGAIVVYTIQAGMNSLQLPGELQSMINGFLIIFAVFLNHVLSNKKMQLDNDLADASYIKKNNANEVRSE